MIKKSYAKQTEMEMVTIEDLVPQDHILRQIEENYDFEFVRERLEPYYCKDNGRPALDPVVLFKMMFIGYVFGIRSERQLEKEIQVNVAYRWFLNLSLTERVPDHSTISQNRRRRFQGTDVFRQLFDEVVLQAYNRNLIDGKILYTDSTHLKANANKKKFNREHVSANTGAYLEGLDDAISEDRIKHGKKPFKPLEKSSAEPMKEIKVSKTDPESGYFARKNKPEGFHYLDHRTCDNKHNMITDVFITPGNMSDSVVYLDRLDHQINRFGFDVEAVGLDSGYHTLNICKDLSEKGIKAIVSYRKPGGKRGLFRKSKFQYDEQSDTYTCPEGHVLRYVTTDRSGFRTYRSDPKVCRNCAQLSKCTQSKKHIKNITDHIWNKYFQIVKSNRDTDFGEYVKRRRSETIERSFADAKQLHGYRYARFRGREKVEVQALMTAMTQNIIKMVRLKIKMNKDPENMGTASKKCRLSRVIDVILSKMWAQLGLPAINFPRMSLSPMTP